MHLGYISIVFLIGGVLTAPIQSTALDATAADAAFKRISNSMAKLAATMKSRPDGGSEEQAQQITNKYIELAKEGLEDVRFSTREVRRGPSITQTETLKLAMAIDPIGNTFKSITKGWIDSKEMIVAAGAKKQVKSLLVEGSEGLIGFTEAVISKLPKIDQRLAQVLKNQFVDVLEPAITAYSS
jgi:hypothetical protein